MSKNITIYTTNTCAYCETVKRFLNSKGQKYSVINLDEEAPEVRQKVIEMSGAMTVPVIVIENGEDQNAPKNITVGWNPGKLAAALAA